MARMAQDTTEQFTLVPADPQPVAPRSTSARSSMHARMGGVQRKRQDMLRISVDSAISSTEVARHEVARQDRIVEASSRARPGREDARSLIKPNLSLRGGRGGYRQAVGREESAAQAVARYREQRVHELGQDVDSLMKNGWGKINRPFVASEQGWQVWYGVQALAFRIDGSSM